MHVVEAFGIDKKNSKCQIIEFAVPYNTRDESKDSEKIEQYQ